MDHTRPCIISSAWKKTKLPFHYVDECYFSEQKEVPWQPFKSITSLVERQYIYGELEESLLLQTCKPHNNQPGITFTPAATHPTRVSQSTTSATLQFFPLWWLHSNFPAVCFSPFNIHEDVVWPAVSNQALHQIPSMFILASIFSFPFKDNLWLLAIQKTRGKRSFPYFVEL